MAQHASNPLPGLPLQYALLRQTLNLPHNDPAPNAQDVAWTDVSVMHFLHAVNVVVWDAKQTSKFDDNVAQEVVPVVVGAGAGTVTGDAGTAGVGAGTTTAVVGAGTGCDRDNQVHVVASGSMFGLDPHVMLDFDRAVAILHDA
jgi:hypothetical protein